MRRNIFFLIVLCIGIVLYGCSQIVNHEDKPTDELQSTITPLLKPTEIPIGIDESRLITQTPIKTPTLTPTQSLGLTPKPNPEGNIKDILDKLFTIRLIALKGENVDFTSFFNDVNNNRDYIYFSEKQTYLHALYEREKIIYDSMSTQIKYNEIYISDLAASINLTEFFLFKYKNNKMPSFMKISYEINLIKSDEKWLINTIVSDDEFDSENYNNGFQLQELLEELN